MKKNILLLFAVIISLQITAQTNLRHLTYDEAIKQAKQENKLLFFDFYTDWCGPCRQMLTTVFPQKKVGDFFNSRFVCVKFNAEKEGKELAKKYNVKAYPTFIVIDTEGKVIMTKVGGESAEKFIEEIEKGTNPEKTPQRLAERYKSGERSAELLKDYLEYKSNIKCTSMESYKKNYAETKDILIKYFNSLSDVDRMKEENMFIYETYAQKINDEFTTFMVTNKDHFDNKLKERVYTRINQIYENNIFSYLRGFYQYDASKISKLKNDVNSIGINSDKRYNEVFKFIDCKSKNDINLYMKLCDKEFSKLYPDAQKGLIESMPFMINKESKDNQKKMATILRNQLHGLRVDVIASAAKSIETLEK